MDGLIRLREYAAGYLREAHDADAPEIQSLLISMAQICTKLAEDVETLMQVAPAGRDPD